MNWSKYQEAVFSAVSDDTASLRVEAVAGSGKTTTIVEAIRRAKAPRILALAFNKKIAMELEKRLPPHVVCKTMNSIGHSAWMGVVGKKITLDSDKIYNIAKDVNHGDVDLSEVMALARAVRTNGLVPKNIGGAFHSLIPDELDAWEDIASYYDIEWSEDHYTIAREILVESISLARRGVIDFDDQIYMSALFGAPFKQYDLVIVDEAQDLSLVQHKMLERSIAPGGRLVAVGDSHQAIYGFRGASATSMDRLSQKFHMKHLPLSVSYRCPRSIVNEAKTYVPHIEASDTAPAGRVVQLGGWGLSDLPGSFTVVCRLNAPLFDLAWKIISQGRGVSMLGRDIGKGLTKLIDKLAPESIPISQFLSKMQSWMEKEIARKPKKEGIIRDKCDSIKALANGVKTSKELKDLAIKLFLSENNPIILSSIHRAKGLEWNDVVFLDPHLIPSKYATQPWEKEQEANLAYVAITRSKSNLYYADGRHFK